MLRGVLLAFIFGILSFATPAQAARELVCEGYGHTAQPGNVRLIVDCNDMGKVREALENAYRDIARLGERQNLTDLCLRGVTDARRAPDHLAGPAYATTMLMFCNQGYQYLPLAREEVITDLYRRYRADNLNWQPFFLELLDQAPQASGGTCQFRIVRQPLSPGLDSREVASGDARYDAQRIFLNLDWHTRETTGSRRPDTARLVLDADGGLSGDMKVFHLWGKEHDAGTLVSLAVPDFGTGNPNGRMFSAPVDEHWSMDVHLENCADNTVELVRVNADEFSGTWGRVCPAFYSLTFGDETTLHRLVSNGSITVEAEFRYAVIQSEVLHRPTQTKLLPGDMIAYRSADDGEEGVVWRVSDGTLTQVLYYMHLPNMERMIDAGFQRRDGLVFANGEPVSEPLAPLRRISCS